MTEKALRDTYRHRIPELQITGKWVADTVMSMLRKSKSGITFTPEIPVRPRVKDIDSFINKALYREKPYKRPLEEIQDQVGVRFVFLLKDQVDAACDTIRSIGLFRIDNEKDPDAEVEHFPELFGYRSAHFVVYPICSIPFRGHQLSSKTPCEIQVRTLLQHTFAQISHECAYKPSLCLPGNRKCKLRRVLAQGAALTEVTDGIFATVKNEIAEYGKHVSGLFETARIRFKSFAKVKTSAITPLTILFLDSYREELARTKNDDFESWMRQRGTLLSTLRYKKTESSILGDPSVLLLGYLAQANPRHFHEKWFSDPAYLRDVYHFFGIGFDQM